MSHHGINIMPSLLPLQGPARLKKKRRLRKAKSADIAASSDFGSVDELFVMEDDYGDYDEGSGDDEADTGRLMLSSFNTATMREMLTAQEER